ncbi:MAG: TonB-dependent receptor, partial [Gemmatimonadales bacterium]|nr:TonB-dependent receptor [Gemmatimonadales bacterium]
TDAEQWTVGLSGRALGLSFEGFHRQWDADNEIGAGMMRVQNHLIPGYRQWTANVARRWTDGATSLDARLGLTSAGIGDATVMPTYRILHADAAESRTFIPFGVALNYMRALGGGVDGGIVGEVASEPPTAEQLYVVVRRPSMPGMRRPDWIGDPTLAQPVRLGARGVVRLTSAQVEVHASHIAGYVLPEARRVGMRPYQTYANVDAALAGLRAGGRLSRLEWEAAYTAGWNLTHDVALAEVAPLTATATWRQPLPARLEGTLRVTGATAQARVDPNLLESSTAAWARLDAGLFWQGAGGLRASIEVDNLTDALYHQHLSYFRDPFASGARVTEPGRTLRVGVSMDL